MTSFTEILLSALLRPLDNDRYVEIIKYIKKIIKTSGLIHMLIGIFIK